MACRTVHLAAFALLLGGHVWGVDADRLRAVLWATVSSGLALAALELVADRRWLLEVRGLLVVVKLGLVLLVPFLWEHRVALLMAVVVIASVGAHMPRWFRHASLVPRIRRERRTGMNEIVRVVGLGSLFALIVAPGGATAEPLAPLPAPPAAKAEQVELGKLLFFDPRLSGDGSTSCDSCHDPSKGWADGKPLSAGYPGSEYFRNAQTVLNAGYYTRNYWDGRMVGSDLPTLVRDHLTEAHFMQVDGRLMAERLKQVPQYTELFRKAFGAEPSFGRTITAVAAFVKTLRSRNAPIDRYLRGDTSALSAAARQGLDLFEGKAGCVQCHGGALLSDQRFHALGVPANPDVFTNPFRHITFRRFFRTLGAPAPENYREDPGLYGVTKEPADWGKFRTPSLREVSRTAPYMHNGSLATLEDVVAFYDRGGGARPNKSPLLKPLGLTDAEQRGLVEFLRSLAGDPLTIERPDLQDYQPRTLGRN